MSFDVFTGFVLVFTNAIRYYFCMASNEEHSMDNKDGKKCEVIVWALKAVSFVANLVVFAIFVFDND